MWKYITVASGESFDSMIEQLFVPVKVRSLSESDLSSGVRAAIVESKCMVMKQA